MSALSTHLMIMPIVLPLLAGGLMLLFDGRNRNVIGAASLLVTICVLGISIYLLQAVSGPDGQTVRHVYLVGNWAPDLGIVLVADRLTAFMLTLTSILAVAALVFSLARWHTHGGYFHPLFQFLLMGLNGAFLTGDLFNLFVFFEVLLAASYGLALYGGGLARVRAGMHYVAMNLMGASLFLVGVSLIYGTAGTLNMAYIALRLPDLVGTDRLLFEIGAAILGMAFLLKAAMWPLGFWLPATYSAAAAPAAAFFVIMTKVGIYAILRIGSLTIVDDGTRSVLFGENWLLIGGLFTILFSSIGMLASQLMPRLGAYTVILSAGTLMAVVETQSTGAVSGAMYYLASSTLACAAFLLLIELIERGKPAGEDILAVTIEAYGLDEEDDTETDEVGVAIPATMSVLGISFMLCALIIAGMPPLSGFIGKFAILSVLLGPGGPGPEGMVTPLSWALFAVIIGSGMAALIAMMRAGIRAFWGALERDIPRIRALEFAPIAALLLLCVTLTIQAGPAMTYLQRTAEDLSEPRGYIDAVIGKKPLRAEDAAEQPKTSGSPNGAAVPLKPSEPPAEQTPHLPWDNENQQPGELRP